MSTHTAGDFDQCRVVVQSQFSDAMFFSLVEDCIGPATEDFLD